MVIVPGPHQGYWIKEGEVVILWAHSKEHAEEKLKELKGDK